MVKDKNRKKLIKELDKYFSLLVRLKSNYCFCCGSSNNLTCGHVITRKNYNIRWDFDNAVVQCRSCNYTHEFRPEILIEKYIKEFGFEKYQEIIHRSK